MRNHKSLKPEDVLDHGPAKVAMMVASEFWRASSGSEFRTDVIRCYGRARELMGVLETIVLDEETSHYLKPYYQECILQDLLREDRLNPNYVQNFGARLAEAFEKASMMIKASHA